MNRFIPLLLWAVVSPAPALSASTTNFATLSPPPSVAQSVSPTPLLAQVSPLQLNDKGDSVADLQRQLTALGYYSEPVTGFFGSVTQAAIAQFQQDHGLTADGIAGAATLDALYGTPRPSADTATSARNYLHLGDSGDQVSELQRRLTVLGYFTTEITGYFGPETQAAIMAFQQANGLPADGVVGPDTATALRQPTDEITRRVEMPQIAPPTTSASASLLRLGDTGSAVVDLQTRLQTLGLYTGSVTGQFGADTEAAVKQFQRSKGLSPDGIAGPQMLLALGRSSRPQESAAQASATPPVSNERYLRSQQPTQSPSPSLPIQMAVGTPSREDGRFSTTELQKQLLAQGFNPGTVNGSFTPETQRAVAEAQQAHGLARQDLATSP